MLHDFTFLKETVYNMYILLYIFLILFFGIINVEDIVLKSNQIVCIGLFERYILLTNQKSPKFKTINIWYDQCHYFCKWHNKINAMTSWACVCANDLNNLLNILLLSMYPNPLGHLFYIDTIYLHTFFVTTQHS